MFEPGNTNCDILLKKSLRQENKSSKLTKKNFKYQHRDEGDFITKQLAQIVFDMQNKNDYFDLAITEESSLLKQHLSFQVFIPEIKTQIGEKLLKDNNLWIIILVVFCSLCKEKSKYSEFISRNILNTMQKIYQDNSILKSIQLQAYQVISKFDDDQQQTLNQSESNIFQKQLKFSFQEDKENYSTNSNLKQLQIIDQIKYIKEQEITKSNEKLKKKMDDLTNQFQEFNNDTIENQEILVPQIDEIINQQVKELEEELKNQHDQSNKKQRLALREKLYSCFGLKAWRSEQKQIRSNNPIQLKMRGIRILDGLDSRELQTNQVAKVDKILIPNLNDNGLHSIVQFINKQFQRTIRLVTLCYTYLAFKFYLILKFLNNTKSYQKIQISLLIKILFKIKLKDISFNQANKIALAIYILKIQIGNANLYPFWEI